jgi:peptide/nickel transport system substrate-binding protein/oligopeptide transport system substrate-binding protein
MRLRRSIAFPLALALVMAAMAGGCTSENRERGYLYMRLNNSPTTLDPALIASLDDGAIAAKLFNGLVRLDRELKVVPDIAGSWEVREHGLVYRFKLRHNVTFSSGREVRALDVKYSFERVLDPETRSPNTWVFEKILGAAPYMGGEADEVAGIHVVDDYTLDIRLSKPFTPFLSLLTVPAAYVVPIEEVLHRGPDFSVNPVGTGPYVLDEWIPNQYVKLTRRVGYFDQPARVQGIVYRVVPEDLTAVAEFELGNIDVLQIPVSAFLRYRGSERYAGQISTVEALNTYYLGMNCERAPFNDPEVRAAVAQALDRVRVLDTLYEGRGRIAYGPVPERLRQWNAPEPRAYDPDAARRAIKARGLAGTTVHLYITAEQAVVDMAEVMQAYLVDAGLKVELRQLEWSAFKSAVNSGEADMFWLSWWADYADPENFLFPVFHSANIGPAGNRVRFSDAEVDRLIEAGQHAVDMAERNEYYRQAEERVMALAAWVPFWHRTDYLIKQPWVSKLETYPVYSMDKGTDIMLVRSP